MKTKSCLNFLVQVQHGAHEDGGCCITGKGQVDKYFEFLIIAEAVEMN